jgi:lipid II:glycine glycyltransferase (peptidoglycan interpeptide bridge formation enzyme)
VTPPSAGPSAGPSTVGTRSAGAGLTVRAITETEHLDLIRSRRSASFLQTPAWGQVKSEWRRESLGWFRDGSLVGAALVLYRKLPRLKRYLAYLPEGPVIDWDDPDLAAWLAPMTAHLKRQGAFGVRMGPPVVTRRWSAAQVKDGIADDDVRRLGDVAPTERGHTGARVVSQLHELGWKPQSVEGGFAAGQPQFNFQIPLATTGPDGARVPRTEDDVLKGMNQQWRRNIKKAGKEGVEVTRATGAQALDELKAFHDLYVHTAERDHFTPRPLSYFRTMVEALGAEEEDRITLWFARHEGDLVASTIAIRVGAHAWYSYGASSTEKRDVRGSNAVQWAMISDALAAGADVYDLRGITDTLDADDPHVGLIQFKVGTGGEAVEYAGEWDLPLNRPLYRAFDLYMKRRG